jgi:cell division protein FtsI/penicillin-binding protein 2
MRFNKPNTTKLEKYLDVFFDLFDRYPREYFIIAFFSLLAFIMIANTFSYSVLNHKKYEEIAIKQQTAETTIEVDRGSVYTNNEK